ncbi:MAG: LysM peptidoglycan-binding domain-containing protein [Patescibacteria group bacterium]
MARTTSDLFERYGLNRSYVSLLLGILVVVIVGIVGLALVRDGDGLRNISLRDILTGQQDKKTTEETANVYTVKEGDNLWSISENVFKSGYNWVDISKANNLENPDLIETGQKLTIPQGVSVIRPEEETVSKIEGSSYRVVEGDNLWSICVRAYGDGYKWQEVAKENNLANPDLLFVGAKLTLPR